jgi:hypothetical protein
LESPKRCRGKVSGKHCPLWGRVHPEGFSLKEIRGMGPSLPNRHEIMHESPYPPDGEQVFKGTPIIGTRATIVLTKRLLL